MIIFLNVLIAIIIVIGVLLLTYVKTPPNMALIISGFRKNKHTKRARVVVGGAALRIPFLERVDKLPLNVINLNVKSVRGIPTADYIDVYVDSIASIKIRSDVESISIAAEKFLGIGADSVASVAEEVIKGVLRNAIGSYGIIQLINNKSTITEDVKELIGTELEKMGLELISFSIASIRDDKDVINKLGATNVERVSNEAQIARAEAEKEVIIKKTQAKLEANEAVTNAESVIAKQNQELEIRKAELEKEASSKKAEASAAYSIQEQKQREELETASVNADIAKRNKEIELRDKEIRLAEQALEAQIKKQAEADKYKIEQLAEAELFERIKKAEAAKAERILETEALIKAAEAEKEAMILKAEGIEKIGMAEAKAIEAKAEAQKKMGEASVIEMYFKILPELVKNISEPLAKTDKIVMFGEGNTTKFLQDTTNAVNEVTKGFMNKAGINLERALDYTTEESEDNGGK